MENCPGVYTTYGGVTGHTRAVRDNHMMMSLLNQLMTAYVLTGNFEVAGGGKWCSMEASYEYLQFTRKRVCPPHEDWPPLQRCLDSEIDARGAWIPHLREGKSLTEAISLTKGERAGAWTWATPQLNAAYFNAAKASNAAGPNAIVPVSDPPPSPIGGAAGSGKRASARAKSRVVSTGPSAPKRVRQLSQPPVSHTLGVPATHSSKGNRFCEKINKGRCCEGGKCPDGDIHACNDVDARGRICGLPGKRRCNHGVGHQGKS